MKSASSEQISEAIGFVEEALDKLGYDTVTEENIDDVKDWLDEAYKDE